MRARARKTIAVIVDRRLLSDRRRLRLLPLYVMTSMRTMMKENLTQGAGEIGTIKPKGQSLLLDRDLALLRGCLPCRN